MNSVRSGPRRASPWSTSKRRRASPSSRPSSSKGRRWRPLLAQGPLSPQTVAALAMDLARTVEAVHEARIVHRDIKPSNIICSLDGPVLIDFGIAMTDGDEHFRTCPPAWSRAPRATRLPSSCAPRRPMTPPIGGRGRRPSWPLRRGARPAGRGTSRASSCGCSPGRPISPGSTAGRARSAPGAVAGRERPARVDEIVEELVAAFGLPRARSTRTSSTGRPFADEADRARTQVIAPPPSPEPPRARGRCRPRNVSRFRSEPGSHRSPAPGGAFRQLCGGGRAPAASSVPERAGGRPSSRILIRALPVGERPTAEPFPSPCTRSPRHPRTPSTPGTFPTSPGSPGFSARRSSCPWGCSRSS